MLLSRLSNEINSGSLMLTVASPSISVQCIACPASTSEGAGRIDTVVLATTVVAETLINI